MFLIYTAFRDLSTDKFTESRDFMFETFETLRKQRKMKYSDVAKGAGIPYSTITDWKAGRYTPKLDKLKKIADYFGVSVEYLLTGQETEVIMETKVLDHPCLHDLAFMDHVFKLWSLPLERRDAVFQQIQFQLDAYDKEIKEKEKVSNA